MISAIKRFLIIVLAYAAAVLIAAVGGAAVILLTDPTGNFDPGFLVFAGIAAIFIGIFTAIPAALLVCLAEYWPIRSLWYYIAVAVVAGLVLGRVFATEWWLPLVGASLGVASGGAYWAIAGRHAGVLKKPETARAQTHLLLLLGTSVIIVAVIFKLLYRF